MSSSAEDARGSEPGSAGSADAAAPRLELTSIGAANRTKTSKPIERIVIMGSTSVEDSNAAGASRSSRESDRVLRCVTWSDEPLVVSVDVHVASGGRGGKEGPDRRATDCRAPDVLRLAKRETDSCSRSVSNANVRSMKRPEDFERRGDADGPYQQGVAVRE